MAFSFSQFIEYDKCPRRYKLKYIDRIFSEPTEALSKGIEAHKTIDDAINGDINKTRLPSAVKFDLPTLSKSPNSPFTMSLYGGISIPSRVIATPNETYIIASEVKLCVDRNGKPANWSCGYFRGVLDCIVAYDVTCWSRAGKIYLYDWKTGSSTGNRRQLEAYMYLLHSHFENIEVEGYFVYLDQDRVSRPIINADCGKIWSGIIEKGKQIEDSKFLPRNNFWCKDCPGLIDCPEKKEAVLKPFGSFDSLISLMKESKL